MIPYKTCLLAFVVATCGNFDCHAELTAKAEKKEPPIEVSEAVKATLGEPCYQIIDEGQPLFEFWLSKSLPLKENPSSIENGLDAPAMASLIGVVHIHKKLRDYRDDELQQGIFTMRFGKIPADGNHLGASEYPYFAVLIPAEKDQAIDAINSYKKMTRASSKETASEHPMIMSLRPIKKKPSQIPALTEPVEEHKCLVVSAKGKVDGSDKETELIFEIVVEGFGEI